MTVLGIMALVCPWSRAFGSTRISGTDEEVIVPRRYPVEFRRKVLDLIEVGALDANVFNPWQREFVGHVVPARVDIGRSRVSFDVLDFKRTVGLMWRQLNRRMSASRHPGRKRGSARGVRRLGYSEGNSSWTSACAYLPQPDAPLRSICSRR